MVPLIIAGAVAVRALRLVLHVQAYEWPASSRGAKAVTVNRELVALSRAASLATHQHGLGGRVAPWAFCRLNGVPGGDFERAWATAYIRAGFFRVVGTDGGASSPRCRPCCSRTSAG